MSIINNPEECLKKFNIYFNEYNKRYIKCI